MIRGDHMNGRADAEAVSPTTTTACAKKTGNAGKTGKTREAGEAGRATTAPAGPGASGPAARRATAG